MGVVRIFCHKILNPTSGEKIVTFEILEVPDNVLENNIDRNLGEL